MKDQVAVQPEAALEQQGLMAYTASSAAKDMSGTLLSKTAAVPLGLLGSMPATATQQSHIVVMMFASLSPQTVCLMHPGQEACNQ